MPDNEQFTQQDVRIESTETAYNGFFKVNKVRLSHRLFEGGWTQTITRELFERGHAVAVLLYDPELKEFVLIRQFRVGAMATCDSPWLNEVVAGMIDAGESADEVCLREAHEEAGVRITALTKALSYLSSPGGTTERIHVYIGRVDATQAQGIHGLDSEHEDIQVFRIDEAEAVAWMEQGKLDNAAALIALQWFVLNKQRVLDEWRQTE